jgi:putative membrane protein
VQLPYCGTPPSPETLLSRFNLDPVLIAALVAAATLHWLYRRSREGGYLAGAGWAVTTLALISPLCALSVSLFAARVGQHMLLIRAQRRCWRWPHPRYQCAGHD